MPAPAEPEDRLLARVAENYAAVRSRIATAAQQAGRTPREITLVAVTKYAEWDWVQALLACGATELGENYPQQLLERVARLEAETGSPRQSIREQFPPVQWHLIGPLQRNKIRKILPAVAFLHAVDSLKLLTAIDRIALELGLRPRVMLEVNISGEASKHGFSAGEMRNIWADACALQHIEVCGLMTMAARAEQPEQARPVFSDLRNLRDELQETAPAGIRLPYLSMGMSGDFEAAIAEGATHVRVGSLLWSGLPLATG